MSSLKTPNKVLIKRNKGDSIRPLFGYELYESPMTARQDALISINPFP